MSENKRIATPQHDVTLLDHSPDFRREPALLGLASLFICRPAYPHALASGGGVSGRRRRISGLIPIKHGLMAHPRNDHLPDVPRCFSGSSVPLVGNQFLVRI